MNNTTAREPMAADQPTAPRKAPWNYLIGRVIHERRVAMGYSTGDLQPRVGLTPPYIRGIESGSTKCPPELALGLSTTLKWDYGQLSMLLVSAAALDSVKKTAGEPAVVMPKLLSLSDICPSFGYVWDWCVSSLNSNATDLLSTSLKKHGAIPRSQANAARAIIERLLIHLATPGAFSSKAVEPTSSTTSPFFAPVISELDNVIEGLRDTLKHATPIVSQEGIAFFDRKHRENIVSAHAFLRYHLRPETFDSKAVTWEFLKNKHSPTLDIYTPYCGEVTASQIEVAIRKRMVAQQLSPPESSFVRLHESIEVFEKGFSFNLPARSIKIGSHSEQGSINLQNAWIYELVQGIKRTYLGMLDSYKANDHNPLYGVSISPDECVRLLSMFQKKILEE